MTLPTSSGCAYGFERRLASPTFEEALDAVVEEADQWLRRAIASLQ